MAKVYVTQENAHDFSGAEAWGEVIFMTIDGKDDLVNTRNSIKNEALLQRLRWHLRKFDETQDWVVLTGSPYVNAAVFLILGAGGMRSIRILRWDGRDRAYRPMQIDLPRVINFQI